VFFAKSPTYIFFKTAEEEILRSNNTLPPIYKNKKMAGHIVTAINANLNNGVALIIIIIIIIIITLFILVKTGQSIKI